MKTSRRFSRYLMIIVSLIIAGMPLFSIAQQVAPLNPRAETRKIVPQPRENIRVELWFDKNCGAPYREGEKIILNFRANTNSYLTIYDIDTRGQVSVLFPNRQQPDNFVKAGQLYTFPDRSYSYDLVVEGPEGIEYVDAVASLDPYYHWNFNQGEPQWIREWGLKNRQAQAQQPVQTQNFKRSEEYTNRPADLGQLGEQSLQRNFSLSNQLRDQVRSKIIATPRSIQETPRQQDYGTATCYFYVVRSGGAQPYPQQPQPYPQQPQTYPSAEDYLRQQQQEFQQIPDFAVRQSGQRLIVTIPNTILFDSDSYALRYESRRDLDQIANILIRYPETLITIAGHTDSIGDPNYNQRLSEYRAQSVANYLASQGVQPYRISSVGYGQTMPVASNSTESGRQRNRRVELDIRVNPQYGK